MFITIEGGEGVGKTTQMQLLKDNLPKLYPERNFVFTLEPGGTSLAKKIREIILSDEAKDADGPTMFGLFAAARADHLRRVILPALLAHKTVISDRFIAATYAYQVCAMESPVDRELFVAYERTIEEPDLTLILDLDPEVSQARTRSRTIQVATHFDTRPLEFHQKLREAYRTWARMPHAITQVELIDASGNQAHVHASMLRALESHLNQDN